MLQWSANCCSWSMQPAKIDRRRFVGAAFTAAALTESTVDAAQENLPRPVETRRGDMLYRAFGKTGETVSVIGVGGSHIGQASSEELATRIIRTAIDHGVNFMDNSWDYNNGNGQAEIRMGKALRDGYRQKTFLMTKVDGRTRQLAAKQLDESLKRLQTDHVDLLQFHETIRMEDPDRFFAPGGALEAFLEARKAGKIRYIGFTGHKDPAIHLRMLELARDKGFHFDAVLFPSNVMDWSFRSFVHQVMPLALKEGIGVQTMKPMGGKFILESGIVTPTECLQYALSQPTSVVIHGMETLDFLNHALGVVKNFHPLSEPQIAALGEKAKQAASSGKYELFKTTNHFDTTAKYPEWLG
ncbi:MAG TPA: aldo/keto reductase [Bryobacteraceae bacterium]|jgi:predicted aldo/keto reductase-like oxidoreductase|nr:aldo/keto reductase [Bryobacteraceae bacterium]